MVFKREMETGLPEETEPKKEEEEEEKTEGKG